MYQKNFSKLTLIILSVILISSCAQPISYTRPSLITNFGDFNCNTRSLANKTFSSIWEKLNTGFCLDTVHSSRVDKEIKWFLNNKDFIYRSIERSKPFLFHIVKELEKRNLPFELALLPLVESGYQPFAHSPSKASGIWQFIPPTAREYKLSKSWWYDGRRDIVNSTRAASRFLRDMHRHFKKDWLLAIASYNTGAGNVGKSIRRANFTFGNVNYWELNLPKETEIYVPKLLALRDIIASSDRYGIRLANLPNKPTTGFVKIKRSIDFYSLSILSDVPLDELYMLNPGFSAWYFIPSFQNKLILPINKIEKFKERYAKFVRIVYSKKTHTIQRGDSLSKISRLYNVSIKSLKVLNDLKSDLIIAGKELKLPIEGVSQNNNEIKIRNKSYKIINDKFNYYHTVKRYDNWYKIAKYYNVKLSQILDWNNAQKNTKLYVGNKVIIKMRKPILSSGETINLRYVVNTGDTAAIISSGFDITPEILLKQNNIKQTRYLVAGKSLLIKK